MQLRKGTDDPSDNFIDDPSLFTLRNVNRNRTTLQNKIGGKKTHI